MTENLIPVLKMGHPIGRKDNKPMELTWHIMKTMGSRHSSCTSSGKQAAHSSLPTSPNLELRTPSSTCSTISTPTWTSHPALWESCYFYFFWCLEKFSDESAVMGCIREDDREEYRATTLLHGASKTILNLTWQKLRNWLWTGGGIEDWKPLFPSMGVFVGTVDNYNTSVFTMAMNWTSFKSQKPSTRRVISTI